MTLTQKDLDEIEKVVDEKINEAVSHLPTKDDFYTKMDEVMGELQAMREENAIGTHKLSNHEDRITALEEHSTH